MYAFEEEQWPITFTVHILELGTKNEEKPERTNFHMSMSIYFEQNKNASEFQPTYTE